MTVSSPLGTTLRVRVRNWLGTLQIWSPGLAIYAAGFFGVMTYTYDIMRLGRVDIGWILIWFGTYVETLALVALGVFVLPRSLWANTKRGAASNLVIAGLAGAIKNSTVFWWATALGLETSAYDPLIRIGGGAVLGASILWSWTALSASRTGHRNLMLELRKKQTEMLRYRDSVGAQVTNAQSQLIDQTKQTLLPKLSELEARMSGNSDVHAVVTELQQLVEGQVRPLSRALEHEAQVLSDAPHPEPLDPEAKRVFPKRFRIRENLPPLAVLAAILPMNALTAYMLLGSSEVLNITLSGLITAALIWLWRQCSPRDTKVRRITGLTVLAVGSGLVGLPEVLFLSSVVAGSASQVNLLAWSVIVQTALGVWLTAYLNILDDERVELENQMLQVNEQLNHELALFNQALWLQKRRWSYLLHGTVQATLTAAIARLSSLARGTAEGNTSNTETGMLIELVRQDLRKIALAITTPPSADLNLVAELSGLQQTWRGVLDINFTVSERAKRAIDKSANLRMALNEICREATTNAFRHGQASKLGITIERAVDNEILVTITNNGSAVTERAKGLGLQMLDALTVEWHWSERKTTAQTILTARLPIGNS